MPSMQVCGHIGWSQEKGRKSSGTLELFEKLSVSFNLTTEMSRLSSKVRDTYFVPGNNVWPGVGH